MRGKQQHRMTKKKKKTTSPKVPTTRRRVTVRVKRQGGETAVKRLGGDGGTLRSSSPPTARPTGLVGRSPNGQIPARCRCRRDAKTTGTYGPKCCQPKQPRTPARRLDYLRFFVFRSFLQLFHRFRSAAPAVTNLCVTSLV